MKVEQISKHIWSLKIWLVFPIQVWIVVDADGVTLVDAGLPFLAKKIQSFIRKLNRGPLQRILLTHGHADHIGAIERLLRNNGVPVYAHSIEIPYMTGEKPYPRRKKPARTYAGEIVQSLSADPQGSLEKVGGLKPYHTPGHSPGHVVYYHEQDQVLLAGDLFTAKNGKLRKPMAIFTADMDEAIKSSAIIGKLSPRRLEVSHGSTVLSPADQMCEYHLSAAASQPAKTSAKA